MYIDIKKAREFDSWKKIQKISKHRFHGDKTVEIDPLCILYLVSIRNKASNKIKNNKLFLYLIRMYTTYFDIND